MRTRCDGRLIVAGICALALLCAAGPAVADKRVPRPDHVVIVMEENHGYDQIIGSADAPYINSLASQGER